MARSGNIRLFDGVRISPNWARYGSESRRRWRLDYLTPGFGMNCSNLDAGSLKPSRFAAYTRAGPWRRAAAQKGLASWRTGSHLRPDFCIPDALKCLNIKLP
jgi:hypothetical protein